MLDNGQIVVIARGRPEGMKKQISGLALRFNVVQAENGGYKLEKVEENQLVFPSIFPRQLDFLQNVKDDKLVLVQDTPDEEDFEAFTVDLKRFRSDGENQWHQRHIFPRDGSQ